MKFIFIVLVICLYITSQATIDARTRQVRKISWPLSNNSSYQKDLFIRNWKQRRQPGMFEKLYFICSYLFFGNSGWGKRQYLTIANNGNDLSSHDSHTRNDNLDYHWFNSE